MGTRWSALFHTSWEHDPAPLRMELQQVVDRVDAQMSTWKPDSDLIRLNRAPMGQWLRVPPDLARVLTLGLRIGRASGGALDIGMGDAVRAWGFGPDAADPDAIRAALGSRRLAHEVLEIDGGAVRKTAPVTLELNGIAKGYRVDCLAQVLVEHGIAAGLVGIDGEMRALSLRPDGTAWTIAVEAPDPDRRTPHSILMLQDAAVATSGDYRHWVTVQGRRLSHTMDPRKGAPLAASPASVSVVAPTCAEADAWATALMVAGPSSGTGLAAGHGLDALFLLRDGGGGLHTRAIGRLFGSEATAAGRGQA